MTSTGQRAGGRPSFAAVLRRTVHPLDLVAIAAVPVVLAGVYRLPAARKEALVFSYLEPTLLTAVTAPYVHFSLEHLLANVGVYLLVVPLAYVLSVLSGHRRRFWIVFAAVLLGFPAILSYLNLAMLRPSVTFGFSGLAMAFVGFLPLALASYIHVQFTIPGELDLAAVFFFAGLALIALLSAPPVLAVGLAAAAVFAAVLAALPVLADADRLAPDVRAAADEVGSLELASVGGLLFVLLTAIGFPADPVVPGGVVNLYVHFLGFALGFLATYLTVQLDRGLPGGDPSQPV